MKAGTLKFLVSFFLTFQKIFEIVHFRFKNKFESDMLRISKGWRYANQNLILECQKKLTLWSFSPAFFDISNIYLSWWISDPKIDLTQIFSGFLRLEIRESKSIFEMLKIADGKLQGASFHNHLVAG